MRRWTELLVLSLLAVTSTGCRCAPGFNCYANFIDDVGDTEILFDSWYFPRFDISRAGRPDWCGPINRRLAPCRCRTGTYKQYDDCWRYPPGYPTWYPGQTVLPPEGTVVTPVPGAATSMPPATLDAPVPVPGTTRGATPPPPPPPEIYEEGKNSLPAAPPPLLQPPAPKAPVQPAPESAALKSLLIPGEEPAAPPL